MPTPPSTDNHGLPLVPPVGEDNAEDYSNIWGSILNNEGWSELDELLVARDIEANRTNYTAYEDSLFWATDSGAVYTGTGTEWTLSDAEFVTVLAETVEASDIEVSGSITTEGGLTIWDGDENEIPTDSLSDDSVTVAGNTIELGGASDVAHDDLSNILSDDHHEWPVPNSGLQNDTVSVAGNSVELGGSTDVAHGDLDTVSDDDHHAWPVPNSGLYHDSVTVAGNTVALGNSTSVAHADLSNVESDDHHSRYTDDEAVTATNSEYINVTGDSMSGTLHMDAPIRWGPGNRPVLEFESLSGDGYSDNALFEFVEDDNDNRVAYFGFRTSGGDLDSATRLHFTNDTDGTEFDISDGYGWINGEELSTQEWVSNNFTDYTFSESHNDLIDVGSDDHHIAHEHPGDRSAESDIDLSGNDITNVSTLTGEYAQHSFSGSTYNIDLQKSDVDARYRNTTGDTIVWVRNSGDIEIPNGELSEQGNRVATRTWSDSNKLDIDDRPVPGDNLDEDEDGVWSAEAGGPEAVEDENISPSSVSFTDGNATMSGTSDDEVKIESTNTPQMQIGGVILQETETGQLAVYVDQ